LDRLRYNGRTAERAVVAAVVLDLLAVRPRPLFNSRLRTATDEATVQWALSKRKAPRESILIYWRNKLRQWRCSSRGRAVSLLLATSGRENDGEWADNVAIGSGTIGSCGFDATKLYY